MGLVSIRNWQFFSCEETRCRSTEVRAAVLVELEACRMHDPRTLTDFLAMLAVVYKHC